MPTSGHLHVCSVGLVHGVRREISNGGGRSTSVLTATSCVGPAPHSWTPVLSVGLPWKVRNPNSTLYIGFKLQRNFILGSPRSST
jgi:hypothetical protein